MSDRRFRFERDARRDRELDEAEYRGESSVRRLSPGKRARSARLGGGAPAQAVVQHRREGAAVLDDQAEREIAARGAFDPAGPLPYLEELQRAFGRHQLGDVRVATGSDAERANQEMGSVAYAMGEAIVFRDPNPDLFTVAHEAAHVVQQRAGAVASGTVGRAGDRHEAHADAVAERVVRGESAEDLLDQVAAGGAPGGGRSGPAPVQRLDDEDYEGLSTYQAIWRALLDDEAEDALALMGRIEGASEANLVLNSAQALARRCFDDGEMAEAAGILVGQGGSLGRALEWMWDEGNDWIEVLTVISCATRAQRAALTTDTWRARLVSELDADEMSALVDLLGLSLHDQLTWMWQVGVDDWSLVRSKIVAAPDDERAALVTDEWRDWFVDEFDSDEVSELVDLLPMPLESKLWWM
ncbi:MAG TPA: DUF4157 domain-containing protein, partial [Kofleriaceae bacterium]|nr:DUF4157 domain-containing protein [Kofleriaceae bacterium]